jgi:hypothetical protein
MAGFHRPKLKHKSGCHPQSSRPDGVSEKIDLCSCYTAIGTGAISIVADQGFLRPLGGRGGLC